MVFDDCDGADAASHTSAESAVGSWDSGLPDSWVDSAEPENAERVWEVLPQAGRAGCWEKCQADTKRWMYSVNSVHTGLWIHRVCMLTLSHSVYVYYTCMQWCTYTRVTDRLMHTCTCLGTCTHTHTHTHIPFFTVTQKGSTGTRWFVCTDKLVQFITLQSVPV